MWKLKYIIIITMVFTVIYSAEALDIQYGTILSIKGQNILIEYNGIGKKQNFNCNVTTKSCSSTKKMTLGIPPSSKINKSLIQELRDKKASHVTLSPSGNILAYYLRASNENQKRTFMIQDLKKIGKEYSATSDVSYWDLVDEQGKVFDFSPNSKNLAYLNDEDGVFSLYLIDTTTLNNILVSSTKLSTSAYQIDDFIFTDDQTLYYIGNTKDNQYIWSLYRYNLKTKKDTIVESNVSYSDSIRKVGSYIIFSRLQEKGYGPEIYNLNTKKIEQFKVPNINTKKSTANQEVIKAGTANGVLMKPTKEDKSKTYPLVIWLHGGPYRQTSYGYHPFHSYGIYDSILELLRKNNVIVLKLDYAGSFGFGRAYSESIKDSVGKREIEDVMSAVTYARNRYHISDVYLAGNSYGGYMSLKALTEHPDTFKGVISINGVTDWESLLTKMQTSIFNIEFNGLPDIHNRTLYDQASIIDNIGKIGDQKIKIIAGEADRTIPFWQATTLYDALKTANKNVTLVSYKGEDHVYKEKKTIEDLCSQIFSFVEIKVDSRCTK